MKQTLTESLILAQDERWRRVLGMQVERFLRPLLRKGLRAQAPLAGTCPP